MFPESRLIYLLPPAKQSSYSKLIKNVTQRQYLKIFVHKNRSRIFPVAPCVHLFTSSHCTCYYPHWPSPITSSGGFCTGKIGETIIGIISTSSSDDPVWYLRPTHLSSSITKQKEFFLSVFQLQRESIMSST
jgi:hypothetical protein